ncbi:MAG: biopolymer transporter ExbD [Calditrichaeota bacterium]|nr:MAG: biopolymer transporter ExbD [Calditrichota bacterium]MBL1206678.1 biopolymer transporter ExbD [Calditrichota bacterium]NOG46505.1 biopolymer transporter ExbD [Calditrichota bacterium]
MFLAKPRKNDGEIPTSSLADIVFLLLIFFLVTTSIDVEKGISLHLPEFPGKEKEIHPDNLVNIMINGQNRVAIDGEEISLAEITSLVKTELADHPELVVSIKSNSQADYNTYIKVLDKVKKAWGNKPARISIADADL